MLSPKVFTFIALSVLIFSAPALAHESSSENLESFTNLYNSVYEKASSALKTLVGTETIKITYKLADGDTIVFGVKTVDGKITESSPVPFASSTLAVSLSEETLNKIANSADPLAEFKNAWGGEIKVEGLTFTNIIKIFIVNVIKIFTSFFSPAPASQQPNFGIQGPVRIIGEPGYPYYNPAQYGGIHSKQYFAASEDIGKCGTVWNYTVLEGMSVVIKQKDGTFCKEYPVNLCTKVYDPKPPTANVFHGQPFYYIKENLPIGKYLFSLNLPEGWGYSNDPSFDPKKVYASRYPREMAVSKQSYTQLNPTAEPFYITKGAPTPARISCDGGTTSTQTPASTTTTMPPTTTAISATTTTGATTTTSNPMPDLEITAADISDATYNSTSHFYKLNIVIRNKGSIDSGLFNTSLIAYNSSTNFYYSTGYPAPGWAVDGNGNSLNFQINNIPVGSQITKTFLFNFDNYDFRIMKSFMLNFSVDFQNQVSESNENNNFVSKNVSVVSGGTTTTTTSTTITDLCGDAFVMAYNSTSGECNSFPVNCVPSGWAVGCPGPTTTSAGLPDLTAKSSGNFQGSFFSTYLNFSVTNSGTANAGAFDVNVTVQNWTTQYNPSGIWYTGKTRINSLAAGATTYISFNVTNATYCVGYNYCYIPNGATVNGHGRNSYYVNITADYLNEVSESNENNNKNSTFIHWNTTNTVLNSALVTAQLLQFIGSTSYPTG